MKYWVYMNGEILPGSYEPDEFVTLPGFLETAMVCPSESGIEDRNWKRAGMFPDILEELRRYQRQNPPGPPVDPQPEPGPAKNPDDILNNASSKIFGHVTGLMKELENRREERALSQSLQRQMIELKNKLQALREKNQHLQERVDLLQGFQKRENKREDKIRQLETEARESETEAREKKDALTLLNEKLKALRIEHEKTRKSEIDLSEDLIRQSKTEEEQTAKMAESELQLARAFGIIAKLESMLGDILPGATAGIQKLKYNPKVDDIDIPETVVEVPPEEEPATEVASDTEMQDLKPDWPEEGEVKPVPPPWKVRLSKVKKFVKKHLPKKSSSEPGSDEDAS